GEAWQVVVHVDAPVLADPEEEGQCELEDGLHVSAETCRRVACDASVVTMTHGPNGEILDVGRKSRKIPRPLWRALAARDRMCRFPGCSRTGHLVAHHVRHWANQGETSLTNCVLLCRGHHWAVHEGGFRMEGRAPGGLAFFYPDGKPMPGTPASWKAPADPLQAFRERHRALGLEIDASTSGPCWDGVGMDYELAIWTLFTNRSIEQRRLAQAQAVPKAG
ncbi:MAG: HNH endonuclease, partial [bacterium]